MCLVSPLLSLMLPDILTQTAQLKHLAYHLQPGDKFLNKILERDQVGTNFGEAFLNAVNHPNHDLVA